MSRVQAAYRNSRMVLLYQCTSVLLAFASRKVFIMMLGEAFLGYNAVFSNVLAALNLAELGIGFAITSFLYKPITEKNEERINALIYLYKKLYQILGIIVLVIGIIASLFLPVLISDASHPMGYIRILFFINLAGTVSTYYLAYNRTLMIADQKNYVTASVDTILNLGLTTAQIIVMFLIPRYELFLVLEVLKNILGNVIVAVICNKRYLYLKKKPDQELLKEYKASVGIFVKDAFFAKIGAYVFYGTDNIIIAIFKGSILTGFLSNYTMVVNTLQIVVTQMLSSVQAVLGNYIFSVKNKDKEQEMCTNYLFVNYYIGNFCMICMVFLIQPFIELFFGAKYLLGNTTALLLGVNLMLIIISQMPSQLFSIYQLYRYDKYIVAFSALLNIIFSVALVTPFGINGVLIGTFITSLIYIFSRIFIIWHVIFKRSCVGIYVKVASYFVGSFVTGIIANGITHLLPGNTIIGFFIRAVAIALCAITIPAILFLPSKEEKFFMEKAKQFANIYIHKEK